MGPEGTTLILGDDSTLGAVDIGAPIGIQPDNGMTTAPPMGTTSADTYQQIMEEASYGVTSQPQLTIPPYQPGSQWNTVGLAVEGAIRGLFNQIPQAIGIQAAPVAQPASPLAGVSPLLLIGGAVVLVMLMRKR